MGSGPTLIEKLMEALSGRKQLRRRVDALENIMQQQAKLLEMLTAKL